VCCLAQLEPFSWPTGKELFHGLGCNLAEPAANFQEKIGREEKSFFKSRMPKELEERKIFFSQNVNEEWSASASGTQFPDEAEF
jgi:hypothetical protein